MGQIQVALTSRAGAGDCPTDLGGDGCDSISASAGEAYRGTGLRMACEFRFVALGKRVILAEDFKKPA